MVIWEEDINIKKLIELSETEKLFLPEFQRSFIWDNSQIKLLIDSIYNNYTINSILLWEGGDDLARRRVGGSINEIKIPKSSLERVTYLLDGQQRATSLVLVFTDKDVFKANRIRKTIKINLYFDSEYQGDDPELRFIFDNEQIKSGNEEILLCDLTLKEIFNHFKTRFVNLKHVYSSDLKMLKKEIVDNDLTLEYMEKIYDLKEKILNRKVYDIKQKGNLKMVLDVFERINTQNTKLNIFDIMVAKTYKMLDHKNYFSLRDFLSMIKCKQQIHKDYIKNLGDFDIYNNEDEIDDVTLLFLIMIILKRKFKQKAVLDISTEELLENIKLIKDVYSRSIQQLERFKISSTDLSKFKPILKFIISYLSEHKTLGIKEHKFLEKWFWNTIIYNRYPGAQNEKIEVDFKILKENDEEKSIELFKKDRTRSFNEQYIDAYYNDRGQLYNSLCILLLNNNPQDFNNGILVKKGCLSSDKLEEHHIFPKNSKMGKKIIEQTKSNEDTSDIINNIANIVLITKNTNNSIIQSKDPSEYIKEFEKEYIKNKLLNEFYYIMESQFIDKEMIEMLKSNDFNGFFKKRTELIKRKINNLCE